MKNTLKITGIIALAAVLTFGFLACGDAVDEETTVTIKHAGYGYILGDELKAVVEPTGSYKYQWYTGDKKPIAGEEKDTYKPTAIGEYYVVINKDQLVSDNVKVFAIPTGTWKMTGTDNNNWDAESETGTDYDDEFVRIAKDKFRLDSSQKFTGGSGANEYEWLEFEIVRWEETDLPLPGKATGYPNALKLTISGATQNAGRANGDNAYFDRFTRNSNGSFTTTPVPSPTFVYIYTTVGDLTSTNAAFLRSRPGSATGNPVVGGGKDQTEPREYAIEKDWTTSKPWAE